MKNRIVRDRIVKNYKKVILSLMLPLFLTVILWADYASARAGQESGIAVTETSADDIQSSLIVEDSETPEIYRGRSFTVENGVMTLIGDFWGTDVEQYEHKEDIKKIVAAEGSTFPGGSHLFTGYDNCEEIDLSKLSGYRTKKFYDHMFAHCEKLKTVNISNLDLSEATDLTEMFYRCSSLETVIMTGVDTSNITCMKSMFEKCSKLQTLDLSCFDTGNVTDMSKMFMDCYSLKTLKIDSFNTQKVTTMAYMFDGCSSLTALKMSKFETPELVSMEYMFYKCKKLTSLDLGKMDTRKVQNKLSIFSYCENLKQLTLGKNFTEIKSYMGLDNGTCGWVRGQGSEAISGTDKNAVFTNTAKNTYYKIALFEGKVVIDEECKYGKTLTAVLKDANTSNVTYQWVRDGENISGAVSNTYTLKKEDIGTYVYCRVTSQDRLIKGSATGSSKSGGKVKKLDGPAAPKNLTAVAPSRKGYKDGKILGVAPGMEYDRNEEFNNSTLISSGTTIEKLGTGYVYVRYAETDTREAGAGTEVFIPEGKPDLTGTVTITGEPHYGSVLTAEVKNCNSTHFSYQWRRSGTDIAGATNSTYKLTKEDIGKTISCKITDVDAAFYGSVTSSENPIFRAYGPAAPANLTTKSPSVKGEYDGQILGVDTTMEYATNQDFRSAKNCTSTAITGLKAGVYYVRIAMTDTTYASEAVCIELADGPVRLKGTVTVNGEPYIGRTLIAKVTDGNYSSASELRYCWLRDGAAISGATGSAYVITNADAGKRLSCEVSANGKGGTIKSLMTDIVKAAPTTKPSTAPTAKPTTAPTTAPTTKPTTAPTTVPTTKPSTAPTSAPTTKPSTAPTSAPTTAPTTAPSTKPVTEVFSDLSAKAWYVKAVQFVYDNSIMKGKDGKFDPNAPVTRAEFSQVLYNEVGKPDVDISSFTFQDVKTSGWYAKAVVWTKSKDIANGYPNGKFGVSDPIQREQIALMLYKFAKAKGIDVTVTTNKIAEYTDGNKISTWAKTAMEWAIDRGIMSGKGKPGEPISTFRLDPKGNATRAECASMIKSFKEKVAQ